MELTEEALRFLKDSTPGSIAIYRLNGSVFETLYVSPSLPALNGLTMEEYLGRSKDNAAAMTCGDDAPELLRRAQESARSGEPFDCYFRVFHKALGMDWAHINARVCGELNGCPVFLAIYTNASVETGIYQRILDSTGRKIYVYDVHSYEILYANKAARDYSRDATGTYSGLKCYQYRFGLDAPCADCYMRRAKAGETGQIRFNTLQGRWEHLTGQFTDWCGHDAFIHYIDDITDAVTRQSELEDLLDAHKLQLSATQRLNGDGDIDQRINGALEIMLRYYKTERAYVCLIDEGGATVSNTHESCLDGVAPQISLLQHVDIRYVDRWLKFFERHEVVIQRDIEDIRDIAPDEYSILKEQNIRSYIEAPIIANGELIGFVGADNPPMDKMIHSGDLLLSFAYSLGNAIMKARSELMLENHSRELEAVINNIPIGVSMIRVRDGKPVSKITNPLLRELYGISRDEAGDFDHIAMYRMSGEDRAALLEKMSRLQTPGTSVKQNFRYFPDGEDAPCRWYQMSARSVAFGDETLLFSCLLDVTAEKEAEARDRRNRRMYEAAAELANLSVWEYDVRRHTITMSDSLATRADMHAFSIPKVLENVPECSRQWVADEDYHKLRELYESIDAGAPSAGCEYWYKNLPGSPARCERVFYTTVFDEAGKPVSAYGIGMDITAHEQEKDKYSQSIHTLMAANPDAIGTFRLDLTKNVCSFARSPFTYIEDALASESADGFFERVAGMIIDIDERRRYAAEINREALISAYAEGRSNITTEYRREINGGLQYVRAYFSLLRNPDTGSIECITYAQDITKQRKNDAIFEQITNNEFDYVALLHMAAGKIEFTRLNKNLSRKYQDILGKPGEQFDFDAIRNFTASSWVDAADRAFYLENSPISVVRERLDRDGHFEMSIRGHTEKAPDDIMCRKIQHYYLDGDRDTVLIIQTDVTETYLQQQREAALAKAEAERVTDILDSVSTGICVLRMPDPDHLEGDFVNMQMFRILGYTPEISDDRTSLMEDPVIKSYLKDAFIAVHPDDRDYVKRVYRENFDSRHFNAGNYRVIRRDGSLMWVNQDLTLRSVTPECRVFYASYRLVDKEVELQNKLHRQLEQEKKLRRQAMAANESKSEFLSRMSHDIRTPLNGIIGMTYIAREQDNPPRTADCLEKIDVSSQFLLGLVNDVLDMSKAESGKIELHPEPYNSSVFFDYLNSVIRPLCLEKNIDFVMDVQPVTSVVPLIDPLRINQVFFNLLSNAVKFTPEGGTVTYRLQEHITEDGRLALDGQVEDTGIGMSPEFLSVLFDPFTQESRNDISEMRGTGLGLAIVKKMLDLMGCTISVESAVGRGTVFSLHGEFDCVPVEDYHDEAGKADAAFLDNLRGRHVLLCEDHPLNQEIAKTLLQEKGMSVSIAEDGRLGCDMFRNSAIGFFDVILMDIRMPVMDGYEAARLIRSLPRPDAASVPIIAMTADAFADDVQKCLDCGMNGHISKPVDPEKLFSELSAVM
jgi:signal transduction histidine kinase/CheY-like chemotaxis protein